MASYWRLTLRPATFRGVGFNVDVSAVGGGRRIVNHEFVRREDNYTEDLGRRAKQIQITGYVIGKDFVQKRDALEAALNRKGSAALVLPLRMPILVRALPFSVREMRERGGYAEFEMTFVEAGVASPLGAQQDTQGAATSSAGEAAGQAASAGNAAAAASTASIPLPPERPIPLPPVRPA